MRTRYSRDGDPITMASKTIEPFTMPAPAGSVVVKVDNLFPFARNQFVLAWAGGPLSVFVVTDINQNDDTLTLFAFAASGNASPGYVYAAGTSIVLGGAFPLNNGKTTLAAGASPLIPLPEITANAVILFGRSKATGINVTGILTYEILPGVGFRFNSSAITDDGEVSFMVTQL